MDLTPQGWFGYGEPLLALLRQHRPYRCVEVGTWLGASALPIARCIEEWGGHLWCVDPWTGDPAWRATHPEAWARVGGAYRDFCDTVRMAGLDTVITPLRLTSLEGAAQFQDASLDFLWLDGLHDEASVRADLAAWWPKLRPGGLIAGDDYGSWPGVTAAWDAIPGVQYQHGQGQVGLVWSVR